MRNHKYTKRQLTKRQLTMEEVEELLRRPWLPVPLAGEVLGLNRSASYVAAQRGDIETINIGRLKRAPTRPIAKKLGIAD